MEAIYANEKHVSRRLPATGLRSLFGRLEMQEDDISFVRPQNIEEPFRAMLVHSNDMTPTIEDFAQCHVQLAVLHYEIQNHVLFRQVLLLAQEHFDKPLVFGNIKIRLDNLTDEARLLVLEGTLPFGAILRQERIPHWNNPAALFRVRLNQELSTYFGAEYGDITYGRYRQMVSTNHVVLSQVMEILSPAVRVHG
jgi:chorismate-pyruvate lyase